MVLAVISQLPLIRERVTLKVPHDCRLPNFTATPVRPSRLAIRWISSIHSCFVHCLSLIVSSPKGWAVIVIRYAGAARFNTTVKISPAAGLTGRVHYLKSSSILEHISAITSWALVNFPAPRHLRQVVRPGPDRPVPWHCLQVSVSGAGFLSSSMVRITPGFTRFITVSSDYT